MKKLSALFVMVCALGNTLTFASAPRWTHHNIAKRVKKGGSRLEGDARFGLPGRGDNPVYVKEDTTRSKTAGKKADALKGLR